MIAAIKVGIVFLNIIYFFIKLFPTRNKVVMLSRQSNDPSFEFVMVKEEIKKRRPEIDVVLLCRTLDDGAKATTWNKCKYALHMFTQMYHIATSKVVILDTYCIPVCLLKHKKSLTVIQMWHSMGTMKKFGYTTLDTAEGSKSKLAYAMKMHENYDYIFASAEAYKSHLASGFNCDISKIVTMPLPRLDVLKSEEYSAEIRQKIYAAYPKLKEKPVILYCPTFRKDETRFEENYKELEKAVDFDRYNLVVKLHPLSKTQLGENVLQATEFSTFDMIFVADYVISDYSCVIYEAAVRGIPLYFYNYDMELYTDIRGLAIDYENELPGVISKDAAEIIKSIDEEPYDLERLKCFTDKYVHDTDNATGDIVNFVFRFI